MPEGPEGPEIRRTADRLAEAITPHGKALLTRFDNGLTLYTHNQFYGVWKITAAGERPSTTRSQRVALETATHAILLYSASDIELWPSDEIASHPFLERLGPDVLDPALTVDTVASRLEEPRFRGRALSTLLLDQGFLAGMGNYLRTEVLFQASLPAQRRPSELDAPARHRLAAALLDVPRRSYLARGFQRARGMREDYLTDASDGFRFLVFDRAGEPCFTCGTRIERAEIGGQRLYWCPRCQH